MKDLNSKVISSLYELRLLSGKEPIDSRLREVEKELRENVSKLIEENKKLISELLEDSYGDDDHIV